MVVSDHENIICGIHDFVLFGMPIFCTSLSRVEATVNAINSNVEKSDVAGIYHISKLSSSYNAMLVYTYYVTV